MIPFLKEEFNRDFVFKDSSTRSLKSLVESLSQSKSKVICFINFLPCIHELKDLGLISGKIQVKKEFCGDEIENNRNTLLGPPNHLVKPLDLMSKKGQRVGRIFVKGQTVKLRSGKGIDLEVTIKFTPEGRLITSHASRGADPNGSFYIENGVCKSSARCGRRVSGAEFSLEGLAHSYAENDSCKKTGSVEVKGFSGQSLKIKTTGDGTGPQ